MQLMVPVTIELRKVVLQADIRSPGGRKPMRRSYTYLPTPDAAMVGSEYAVQVHNENVLERRKVEEEFEQAKMEFSAGSVHGTVIASADRIIRTSLRGGGVQMRSFDPSPPGKVRIVLGGSDPPP